MFSAKQNWVKKKTSHSSHLLNVLEHAEETSESDIKPKYVFQTMLDQYFALLDCIWICLNLYFRLKFPLWPADIGIYSRLSMTVRLIFSIIPALGEYHISRLLFEKGSAPAWQQPECRSWTTWWAPEARIRKCLCPLPSLLTQFGFGNNEPHPSHVIQWCLKSLKAAAADFF